LGVGLNLAAGCCIWWRNSLDTELQAVRDSCAAFGFAPKHQRVDSHMARQNPIQFLQQVRQETNKVTWPSRNEVLISTIMVLVLVLFASLFFLAADQLISWLIGMMLSFR
jgi:preprotein translocase subunit SecE